MTKLEAITYIEACAFMRDVKFVSTTWKQDADADEHLAEALEVLGIDPEKI